MKDFIAKGRDLEKNVWQSVKLHIQRKTNGVPEQNCNIYVGFKIN